MAPIDPSNKSIDSLSSILEKGYFILNYYNLRQEMYYYQEII